MDPEVGLEPTTLRLTAEVAEGGSTVLGAFTNAEQIEAFATNAAMDVGSGSGAVYGTAVHTEFANQLRAVDNPSLRVETTWLNGVEKVYGTKGAVRLDVLEVGPAGLRRRFMISRQVRRS